MYYWFYIDQLVVEGFFSDKNIDLSLFATILLTQVLSTEAIEQTIASTSIKQLHKVYVLI